LKLIVLTVIIKTLLICLLQELENSASSDAIVREKIASLPPEVSEIALLSKLEGSICIPDFLFILVLIQCVCVLLNIGLHFLGTVL